MAIEIERKFLVINNHWKKAVCGIIFKQAYLNSAPERTVRIRTEGDQAFITIKSKSHHFSRQEFEYPIPLADAEQLLLLCETPPLEKMRYLVRHGQHTWEVDEFMGSNRGLVLAEIELASEDEIFAKPDWIGTEVSGDSRYFNSNLSLKPFNTW